jgi:hypothetical protein
VRSHCSDTNESHTCLHDDNWNAQVISSTSLEGIQIRTERFAVANSLTMSAQPSMTTAYGMHPIDETKVCSSSAALRQQSLCGVR